MLKRMMCILLSIPLAVGTPHGTPAAVSLRPWGQEVLKGWGSGIAGKAIKSVRDIDREPEDKEKKWVSEGKAGQLARVPGIDIREAEKKVASEGEARKAENPVASEGEARKAEKKVASEGEARKAENPVASEGKAEQLEKAGNSIRKSLSGQEGTKKKREGSKPGKEEKGSGEEALKPGEEEKEPGEERQKLGEEEKEPGEEGLKPGKAGLKLKDGEGKPGTEEGKPEKEGSKSGESGETPDGEGSKSGENGQTPDGEGSKSGENRETPVGGSISPGGENGRGQEKQEGTEGKKASGKEKEGKREKGNGEAKIYNTEGKEGSGDTEKRRGGKEGLKHFREGFFRLQEKWGLLEYGTKEDRVFQTGRLLVEAEQEFQKEGAKEVLHYGRYYILQYDTLEAVKTAYGRIKEKGGGIWAVPDILSGNPQEAWKEAWKIEEEGEAEFRVGFLGRWQELLFSENMEGTVLWGEEVSQPELYNTKEEYYGKQDDCKSNRGYFYLFVRKKEVKIEKGAWYKVEMSLPTVSSYESQAITWKLFYLKKKVGGVGNIANWSWSSKPLPEEALYSLALEKGKSWEKTRQNGSGANPILRNMPAIPENDHGYYFKLCGKLLYEYPGYQMVLDESIYQDLDLFDIEPENMQIQRKDDVLDPDEKSWTGEGYFKFAIDTNNTGMTNYGESHKFHHAVFGLCLKPNRYTVEYKPNGGTGDMADTKATYDKAFALRGNQFSRTGYTFDGWATKPDGSGKRYKNKESGLLNLAKKDGQSIPLYAQWKPKVYKATLKNQLKSPKAAGTKIIYEKYANGWYLDTSCKETLEDGKKSGRIEIPVKDGYVFLGYFDQAEGGTKMIDKEGKLTGKGMANFKRTQNSVWYAQYKYLVSCQDYADIPCDLETPEGDGREGLQALASYDPKSKNTIIKMGQPGFTVSLTGLPKGTKIGMFISGKKGQVVSGSSGQHQSVSLSFVPEEGAAYQLTVVKNGKKLVDKAVYFKEGRFRVLAKLGIQEQLRKKEANGSASGNEWEVQPGEYPFYRYAGCSSVENIQSPETVYRYFVYKKVNVAYHGNGATEGKNMMECDIPLEAVWQVRENPFLRIETHTKKTPAGKPYRCQVKYGFQGWRLGEADAEDFLCQPKEQRGVASIYGQAKRRKAISSAPLEPFKNYTMFRFPIGTGSGLGQGFPELVTEYINFMAEWNAYPTIVLNPENKMEFYEGEEVGKEDLVARLAVHDTEDSKEGDTKAGLSKKVQIRKISYPEPKNKSQKAYIQEYKEDVPEGFLLDTYYMKLEEKEKVNILVTFSVEDSSGNITEEEIPVIVKYNHYPQIESEDVFYFLKEEANQGGITPELLLGYAKAEDPEDGDISKKLILQGFDPQAVLMQTEPKAEFKAVYQVTDAYKKTAAKEIKLVVWDDEAEIQGLPQSYVRYISEKHLETLEENSIWREGENYTYLQKILSNQAPQETWNFSHEDILAVQEWMAGQAGGSWKAGQEANQGFLERFASCRE